MSAACAALGLCFLAARVGRAAVFHPMERSNVIIYTEDRGWIDLGTSTAPVWSTSPGNIPQGQPVPY